MLEFFSIMRKILILAAAHLMLAGCSFFQPSASLETVQEEGPEVQILDAAKLSSTQSVFIVPFKAGVNVASTKELDRIALTIVQGLGESLRQSGSPLQLNDAQGKDEADLLIQGHITQSLLKKSRIPTNKTQKKHLGIEGSVVDRKTRQKLLVFSHEKTALDRTTSLEDLGAQLGAEVGRKLMAVIKTQ